MKVGNLDVVVNNTGGVLSVVATNELARYAIDGGPTTREELRSLGSYLLQQADTEQEN
jgi:hypothetical protein